MLGVVPTPSASGWLTASCYRQLLLRMSGKQSRPINPHSTGGSLSPNQIRVLL